MFNQEVRRARAEDDGVDYETQSVTTVQAELIQTPKTRIIAHICAKELKRYEDGLKNGSKKIKPPVARTVVMAPGLDTRWMVGQCGKCHETITDSYLKSK